MEGFEWESEKTGGENETPDVREQLAAQSQTGGTEPPGCSGLREAVRRWLRGSPPRRGSNFQPLTGRGGRRGDGTRGRAALTCIPGAGGWPLPAAVLGAAPTPVRPGARRCPGAPHGRVLSCRCGRCGFGAILSGNEIETSRSPGRQESGGGQRPARGSRPLPASGQRRWARGSLCPRGSLFPPSKATAGGRAAAGGRGPGTRRGGGEGSSGIGFLSLFSTGHGQGGGDSGEGGREVQGGTGGPGGTRTGGRAGTGAPGGAHREVPVRPRPSRSLAPHWPAGSALGANRVAAAEGRGLAAGAGLSGGAPPFARLRERPRRGRGE